MENNLYHKIFSNNPPLEDLLSHPKWKEWITSEIFVFELINKTTFSSFEEIPPEIMKKPGIILSSLEKIFAENKQILGSLAEDESFFMYCCKLDLKYAQLFSQLLSKNEHLAWWYIDEFKPVMISKYLPKQYCEDTIFSKTMLINCIHNYQYLGENIRNDLSMYEELNENDRRKAYPYAGSNINSNWELSLKIICDNPSIYQFAAEKLQKNPKFYLEALENTLGSDVKYLLQNAHPTIQNNETCVWQSALKNSNSLQFASSRLLNSTSFANQVMASLRDEQLKTSMEFWSLTVKNSLDVFENILPKVINGKALSVVGPELKENESFMLKALLLDSKQTLSCCPPVLINDSNFIIKAYHLIDEKNLHQHRYDEDSEQSQIFDHLTEKATEDSDFIIALYKEFKDIFISIVYPKIKSHHNSMIQELNAHYVKSTGLSEYMEKMLLKETLSVELDLHENKSNTKKPKI